MVGTRRLATIGLHKVYRGTGGLSTSPRLWRGARRDAASPSAIYA
jgi:hypothetical protein